MMEFYAHSNDLDKTHWQRLKDHLFNTANLALSLSAETGLSDFAFLAALFHDIGKYSLRFQKRLEGALEKVDHSTAGAQEIINLLNKTPNQKYIATLLAYCISGHHGGLLDHGSRLDTDEDGTLMSRLIKPVENYEAYAKEIDISSLKIPETLPIKPNQKLPGFSLSFFTRMVYSILVDADFQETESFMRGQPRNRGNFESLAVLKTRMNGYLAPYQSPQNQVDIERTRTLNSCIQKAMEKPGLFTLTVPTGGGKTLSSLAFALHHAQHHQKRRVIYVIPYTTIIEQNAMVFKKCLGDENVLEHHSNFDWTYRGDPKTVAFFDDSTNEARNKLKLASENWDIPIVVTTNVQFFESLFASRSSRCRKLHNIINSVVIFDEVQMLPRDYIQPCVNAVVELVRNYGVTAIFCTATQPTLDRFLPRDLHPVELTDDPKMLYEFFKRVEVKNLGKVTDDEIVKRIEQSPQALCIVNTRKHARGLFEMMDGEGGFHLSTLMCPAHRKKVVSEIRKRLSLGLPCRVVSTQIMEAGIDVDFPVGFRAIAGLDSIIQAAGRVNRERKNPTGFLYLFEPDSQFVKRTPTFIQQGIEVTRMILRQFKDPVCLEAIESYFNLLYDLQHPSMFDARAIGRYFDKGTNELNFDFRTAAGQFKLIDEDTVAVVIPYDSNVKQILKEASQSEFPKYYSRKLQIYTVNIYQKEFEAMHAKGLIETCAETYFVLNNPDFYQEKTGLTLIDFEGM